MLSTTPIDAVIHLAAEATIATSVTDPAKYFLNNVSKGLTLLEAMRRHGVGRIVFSSTAATYGDPLTVPISEDHPLQPINAYGESKLMFERCLTWYHRAYGLRAVSLRYFNAAGATADHGEDRPDETHLIPLALAAATGKRDALDVFGTDYPTPMARASATTCTSRTSHAPTSRRSIASTRSGSNRSTSAANPATQFWT